MITQAITTQAIEKIRVKIRTHEGFFTRIEGADAIEIFAEKDNSALFDELFKARPAISGNMRSSFTTHMVSRLT